MLKVYYIEDLTLSDIDDLIERGVCFDVTSKNTVLSEGDCLPVGDNFWGDGDNVPGDIQQTYRGFKNSKS